VAENTSVRVIYLGGLGRSGTTLLERLLGELPGVCSAGEIIHLWQRGIAEGEGCGCGKPLPDCEFWRDAGKAAFGSLAEVDIRRFNELRFMVDRNRYIPRLAAPALRPSLRRAVTEYTGHYRRMYAGIAEASGCPVVVDSSKHPSLAFCLRWNPEVDLRVVHVVRDSRAVAYSWTQRVLRPESAADPYMQTYSPAATAALWNAQNGALQVLAMEGVPTLRVRYEDLVASPAAVLREIAGFGGIPIGTRGLGFLGGEPAAPWAELSASHTASGNPMRFVTGRIPIRTDDRWRTDMPAAQRRTVTALTLPLLARYGYARPRRGNRRAAAPPAPGAGQPGPAGRESLVG
jgi:Sulfotransferase family